MSDTTPAERSAVKTAKRTGPCLVCTCELFESGVFADGFQHCTCSHTQWSHGVQDAPDGVE